MLGCAFYIWTCCVLIMSGRERDRGRKFMSGYEKLQRKRKQEQYVNRQKNSLLQYVTKTKNDQGECSKASNSSKKQKTYETKVAYNNDNDQEEQQSANINEEIPPISVNETEDLQTEYPFQTACEKQNYIQLTSAEPTNDVEIEEETDTDVQEENNVQISWVEVSQLNIIKEN